MKRMFKNLLVVTFTFAVLFGLSSNINAAYTRSVLKSYKYDYNHLLGTFSENFDHKYIKVADDARLYDQTDKAISSGWNYVRSEVVYYYKNADMNW